MQHHCPHHRSHRSQQHRSQQHRGQQHRDVPAIGQIAGLKEYVDLSTLFEGPLFRIRHWRCLHDGQVLREERASEWDVLSLVDHGAFVHHKGRSEVLIDPTCVVLNQAWEPYRTTHPFGCGDFGFHVLLNREVLRDASQRSGVPTPGPGARTSRIAGRSAIVLRQRMLTGRLRRGLPVEPLDMEENVLTLLGEVLSDLTAQDQARAGDLDGGNASSQGNIRVVEAVRAFLCEHFREPLRLGDVARAVHVSPYHLCRIFKRVSGETIHQYRNRLRLLEALDPVAEPSTDLTTLALDLGFSSHSHFTSAFRRLFGLTPTQLRADL